jgi:hypothetical protein
MIPLYGKQESRKIAHECEKQNEKQTMNIGEFIVSYSIAMYTRNPMKNTRKHRQTTTQWAPIAPCRCQYSVPLKRIEEAKAHETKGNH